jgi:hypothetical protein
MGLFIVGTMPAPPNVNKLLTIPSIPELKTMDPEPVSTCNLMKSGRFIPGSSSNFKQLYHWL